MAIVFKVLVLNGDYPVSPRRGEHLKLRDVILVRVRIPCVRLLLNMALREDLARSPR